MTTAATSLLGLALPVTGELAGTWGTTVNDSITSLLDTAVAGTTTLSTDADVTLTTTTLAANQARQAILLCSGARTALRTITAPAQSKIYTIINATTGGFSVKLVGVGPTTGLTIPNGASAVVAWNGSDFIEIGSATVGNLTVNGNLSVTGTTSLTGVATLTANPVLSAGTANGVAYLNGSKVVTTGSALTFDGTNLTTPSLITTTDASGLATFGRFSSGYTWSLIRPSTTATGIEFRTFTGDALYQLDQTSGSNKHIWYTAGSEQMRLTSTGLGIGTSSPAYKLDVSASVARIKSTSAYSGLGLWSDDSNASTRNWLVASSYNNYGDLCFVQSTTQGGNPVGGTVRAIIDSSGNLGLGVTPSAWNSTSKAFQVSTFVSVSQQASGAANFGFNFYEDAANTFKYSTTDEACRFSALTTGGFGWYNAPSGTAGNAITFTQAMTLDASGNLLVGTTTAVEKLTIGSTTATSSGINLRTTQTDFSIQPSNSAGGGVTIGVGFVSGGQGPMIFSVGSERARIDSSGNLVVGGTTAVYTNANRGNISINGASTAILALSTGSTGRAYLYTDGSRLDLLNTQNDALTFGTNNTERARITSGGEVYIAGTTDQGAYNLQVNGTGVWGAGAYVNGSDARLKEEVQDLAPALDVIASLRPVTFRYKEDYSKDQNVQPGFIAQELQTAMAGQAYVDGVIQSGPQHLNVAYQSLIPLLTKAIQELKAEFDAYKATHP